MAELPNLDRFRQGRQARLQRILDIYASGSSRLPTIDNISRSTAQSAILSNPDVARAWEQYQSAREENLALGGDGGDRDDGFIQNAFDVLSIPGDIVRSLSIGAVNDVLVPWYRTVAGAVGADDWARAIEGIDTNNSGDASDDGTFALLRRSIKGEGPEFSSIVPDVVTEGVPGRWANLGGTIIGTALDIGGDPLTYAGGAGLVTGGNKGAARAIKDSTLRFFGFGDRAADVASAADEVAEAAAGVGNAPSSGYVLSDVRVSDPLADPLGLPSGVSRPELPPAFDPLGLPPGPTPVPPPAPALGGGPLPWPAIGGAPSRPALLAGPTDDILTDAANTLAQQGPEQMGLPLNQVAPSPTGPTQRFSWGDPDTGRLFPGDPGVGSGVTPPLFDEPLFRAPLPGQLALDFQGAARRASRWPTTARGRAALQEYYDDIAQQAASRAARSTRNPAKAAARAYDETYASVYDELITDARSAAEAAQAADEAARAARKATRWTRTPRSLDEQIESTDRAIRVIRDRIDEIGDIPDLRKVSVKRRAEVIAQMEDLADLRKMLTVAVNTRAKLADDLAKGIDNVATATDEAVEAVTYGGKPFDIDNASVADLMRAEFNALNRSAAIGMRGESQVRTTTRSLDDVFESAVDPQARIVGNVRGGSKRGTALWENSAGRDITQNLRRYYEDELRKVADLIKKAPTKPGSVRETLDQAVKMFGNDLSKWPDDPRLNPLRYLADENPQLLVPRSTASATLRAAEEAAAETADQAARRAARSAKGSATRARNARARAVEEELLATTPPPRPPASYLLGRAPQTWDELARSVANQADQPGLFDPWQPRLFDETASVGSPGGRRDFLDEMLAPPRELPPGAPRPSQSSIFDTPPTAARAADDVGEAAATAADDLGAAARPAVMDEIIDAELMDLPAPRSASSATDDIADAIVVEDAAPSYGGTTPPGSPPEPPTFQAFEPGPDGVLFPRQVTREWAEDLANGAAEARLRGGPRATRDYLIKRMGRERGLEAFNSFNDALQGGIGIRRPKWLPGGPAEQMERYTRLMPKGVYVSDKVPGLGALIEQTYRLRHAVMASKAGDIAMNYFGGQDGWAYRNAIIGLRMTEDRPAAYTFAAYDAYRRGLDTLRASGTRHARHTSELVAATQAGLDQLTTADRAFFVDAFHTMTLNARNMFDTPEGLTDGQRIAWDLAANLRTELLNSLHWARHAGVDIGQINDATRVTTQTFQDSISRRRLLQDATTEVSPLRSRTSGFTLGDDGTVVWEDVRKLNREWADAGYAERYIEDPLKIVGSRLDRLGVIVAKKRLWDTMVEAGIVVPGNVRVRKSLDQAAAAGFASSVMRQMDDEASLLARAKEAVAAGDLDQARAILAEAGAARAPRVGQSIRALDERVAGEAWNNFGIVESVDSQSGTAFVRFTNPETRATVRKQLRFSQMVTEEGGRFGGTTATTVGMADPTRIAEELDRVLGAKNTMAQMIDAINAAPEPQRKQLWSDLVEHVEQMSTEDFQRIGELKNLFGPAQQEDAKVAFMAMLDEARGLYRTVTDVDPPDLVQRFPSLNNRIPTERRTLGGRAKVVPPSTFNEAFVVPEVARSLSLIYAAQNPVAAGKLVQEFWNPFMSLWRTYATVGRGPGFAFRNLGGGMWNAYLVGAEGADFSLGSKYARLMRKVDKAYQAKIVTGEIALTSRDELASVYERMVREALEPVTVGNTNLYRMHIDLENSGLLGGTKTSIGLANNPDNPSEDVLAGVLGRRDLLPDVESGNYKRAVNFAANNRWVRANAGLSEGVEKMLRMSAMSAGIRRFGSDEVGSMMAVSLARVSQFDYGDLTRFESGIMRNIAPFFVWTKNNVPLQIRALLHEPGKVLALLRINEGAKQAFGIDDPVYDAGTPEWLREMSGWASSIEGANNNPLVFGLQSPINDLNRFLSVPNDPLNPVSWLSSFESAAGDDIIGSMNPALKFGVESVSGTNTFTGARYQDAPVAPWYDAVDWLPLLPDVRTDPETGERVASGFATQQMRNLLPGLGQVERMVPFGPFDNEKYQDRLASTWLGQTPLIASPVAPLATLDEGQLINELTRRTRTTTDASKRIAGEEGVDWEHFQRGLRSGWTPEEIAELVRQGAYDRQG